MKLHELTVHEAHELLKKKEISSQELTRGVLERIEGVEEKVDAFITVAADLALQQAERAYISSTSQPERPLGACTNKAPPYAPSTGTCCPATRLSVAAAVGNGDSRNSAPVASN